MKARTYKVLYGLLLESLQKGNKENHYNNGLCGEIDNLFENKIINRKEHLKLCSHFKNNKPTSRNRYKGFYNRNGFSDAASWWWPLMKLDNQFRKVRIEFIKEVIKNLK